MVDREDELRALFDAIRRGVPALPPETDPVESPANRFWQMPEHTRRWLEGKSLDDLKRYDRLVDLLPKLEKVTDDYAFYTRAGKILLWTIGPILGASFALTKFGFDVFTYLKGGGR